MTTVNDGAAGITQGTRETLALIEAEIDEHEATLATLAELDKRLGIPGASAVFTATVGLMRQQLAMARLELTRNPDTISAFSAGLSLGRLGAALTSGRHSLEAALR